MTTYRIDGMTCGGCARSVTKAAQSVAPDARLLVDHEKGTLIAEGPHDPSRLKQAIEDAGFDWGGTAPHA